MKTLVMLEIVLDRQEFEELRRLQIKYRRDWPAVFSTNNREVWPFVTRGHTQGGDREVIRGLCKTVDQIADECLRIRDGGGRFFIDRRGAFYKDEFSQEIQFVIFRIVE